MRHFKSDVFQSDPESGVWNGTLVDLDNQPPPQFESDDDDAVVNDINNAAEVIAGEESYEIHFTIYKNGEQPGQGVTPQSVAGKHT